MGESLNLIASALNSKKDETDRFTNNIWRMWPEALAGKNPCSISIRIRNQGNATGSIDPAALRLVLSGQTFLPKEYAIPSAIPLTAVNLAPNEELTGTIVFSVLRELGDAANEGRISPQISYDSESARIPEVGHIR